jgi:hypothetical protein
MMNRWMHNWFGSRWSHRWWFTGVTSGIAVGSLRGRITVVEWTGMTAGRVWKAKVVKK